MTRLSNHRGASLSVSRTRQLPSRKRNSPSEHPDHPSYRLQVSISKILDRDNSSPTIGSHIIEISIVSLILLNVVAVILASYADLYFRFRNLFDIFELVSVIIFSVEYLLRLWIVPLKHPQENPLVVRLRYIFSFGALIDLAAILPFYLPLAVPLDLRFLRVLRISRVLRFIKLQRYSDSMQLVGRVFRLRSKELLSTIFITVMLLVVAASAMYHVENAAQPDKFPNIIASLWWAVATLTTVGYGDVFPITDGGKFLAGIVAILGIGLVALPAGIISSGFMEEINKRKKASHNSAYVKCPHCGKRIHTH
jgi:voltage-gated potassium channel